MHEELHQLIRAGFRNALLQHPNDVGRAFERAIEMYARRRPLLDRSQARADVMRILDLERDQLPLAVATSMRSRVRSLG